jgi:uncharacterized protein YcgL (UPF0745 family)
VDAADAQLRERRTYGEVRSGISKIWISAVRRTSSRGDPKRVERDMAVLKNAFCSSFACDQHHVTKLYTVRSHRLQCLPNELVHHYGQPKAWGAPVCLYAAACADQNRVTLSTQLADQCFFDAAVYLRYLRYGGIRAVRIN